MAAKQRLVQPLLVVMLLLSACAALASAQEKAPGAAKAPAAAAQASVSATDRPLADTGVAAALTRRLTGSTGVTDAVAATREALALGGLSTWDRQRLLVKATAPAASGFAIPAETVALAMVPDSPSKASWIQRSRGYSQGAGRREKPVAIPSPSPGT